MQKCILLFTAVLISSVLYAGKTPTGVHSEADFEKLYKDKIFPFNKLSDTTFQRLKTTIIFDKDKNFRGFNYVSGLWKELTYEEYQKFNELISGIKSVSTKEDKAAYEKKGNRK